MFPEYYPEAPYIDNSNSVFHYPPIGSDGVIYTIKKNTDKYAILKCVWSTEYMDITWEYYFRDDNNDFSVNITRDINKSFVFSNAQQCVMFSSDFDSSYLIDYEGNLLCTMDNHGPTGALASSQHTMFSAIDKGESELLPMLAWYENAYNIIAGVICSYVSPNQRRTASYHGGGSTHSHPGYAEGQFNPFGKSDSESLYLRAGTSFTIQLYYYFDFGTIDKILDFNYKLFQTEQYKTANCVNYWAASYGARSSVSPKYFSRFPQMSSDYICSQELYRPRCIAIPSSQDGLYHHDLYFFDLYVKYESAGEDPYDLTPIYGTEPLFEDSETIIDSNNMTGSMSWIVNSLENALNYQVYAESDKAIVSGHVEALEDTQVEDLYIEFELSSRVSNVNAINDNIIDIRSMDHIYGDIGITLYDTSNIDNIEVNNNDIKLYLIDNSTDSTYTAGSSFSYSFKLFPHIGYYVDNAQQITPFLSAPQYTYNEHALSFPNLLGNKNYGFIPSAKIFPYKAVIDSDSLLSSVSLFSKQGSYPVTIFLNNNDVKDVKVNNLSVQNWHYDDEKKMITIENNWEEGDNFISFYKQGDHPLNLDQYYFFPNPFNTSTNIHFKFSEQLKYKISIYNVKGQLVKKFKGLDKEKTIIWDGTDINGNKISSGVYLCSLKTGNFHKIKKMVFIK
jgi:hypothetical protein